MSEDTKSEPLIKADDLHWERGSEYRMSLSDIKDKVREKFVEAYTEHMKQMTPGAFAAKLTERLQAEQDAVIKRLLGLSNTYGRWEMDSKSPGILNEEIDEQVAPVVKAWVEKNIAKMLDEEMPKAVGEVKKALRAAVRAKINYEFRHIGERLAEQMMKQAKKEVEEEVFGPKGVDK